jgi:phosphatidylinositol-3-phosphatase
MSGRKRESALAAAWLSVCAGAGVVGIFPAQAQTGVPRPDHVVMVIEENHSYADIIGSTAAPYINSLAQQGALFTASFGIAHPSEPNYLALFSGSTQGVTDDRCPDSLTAPNLASELIAVGLTFGGYSEDMPSVGYTGCSYRSYWRKHNPWVDWQGSNLPVSVNMPYTSFPADFSTLPTVAIVVPNQQNDMHDGTIRQADTWLQQHLDPYVQWAQSNNSLLIVTWDEDDNSSKNQIPTIFVGPMVKPGQYEEKINHYNVLRTLEDMYGLPYVGESASVDTIADTWSSESRTQPMR